MRFKIRISLSHIAIASVSARISSAITRFSFLSIWLSRQRISMARSPRSRTGVSCWNHVAIQNTLGCLCSGSIRNYDRHIGVGLRFRKIDKSFFIRPSYDGISVFPETQASTCRLQLISVSGDVSERLPGSSRSIRSTRRPLRTVLHR